MRQIGRLSVTLIVLLWLVTVQAQQPAAVPTDPVILPPEAQIHHLVVEDFWQTNCFIIAGKNREAIIIDPGDNLVMGTEKLLVDITTGKSRKATAEELARGDGESVEDPHTGKKLLIYGTWRALSRDAERIAKVLDDNKLKLKLIILTHGHIDHIGAVGYLKKKTGAQLLMHAADTRCADGAIPPADDPKVPVYPKDAYTLEGGLPKVDRLLKDGDLVKLDGMVLQVIHTPGHSPGGICLRTIYKNRPLLFSGDTLLYHSLGRTNFRDGSGDQELEFKSIRERLFTLPEETIVLTGHYEMTTIGEEKKNNPFLNPPPIADWLNPPPSGKAP
ncbi:MAG: putative metallo-hydrolase [bacterium ADurb.Bin429]|nr:MAG: putative metallo-hydrolase [bacterium ADurb.Bin429]